MHWGAAELNEFSVCALRVLFLKIGRIPIKASDESGGDRHGLAIRIGHHHARQTLSPREAVDHRLKIAIGMRGQQRLHGLGLAFRQIQGLALKIPFQAPPLGSDLIIREPHRHCGNAGDEQKIEPQGKAHSF